MEQRYPDCVPVLTDGVVRLRAHRPDDAERIVEQSADPESIRSHAWVASIGPATAYVD